MQILIADRFLKRFFGSRWSRRRITPASAARTLPANETDKPAEPAFASRENPPVTEAALGNEQTGAVSQLAGPQDASDQPMTDDDELTSDEREQG